MQEVGQQLLKQLHKAQDKTYVPFVLYPLTSRHLLILIPAAGASPLPSLTCRRATRYPTTIR